MVEKAGHKKKKPKRFLAADAMRLLAILLMVQGHVFTEVAGPGVTEAPWYSWHGYVHGFTAPLFLFVAGLVFGLAALGKWEQHNKLSRLSLQRLERFFLLTLLGYAIHVPVWSYRYMSEHMDRFAQGVLRVDALQQIGVSLIICQLVALALRRKGAWASALFTLTFIFVACAPFVWRMDLSAVPHVFRVYLKSGDRTLFPLFPWAGFVLFGGVVAYAQRRFSEGGFGPKRFSLLLVGVGLATWWVGHTLTGVGFNPFGEHNYWKTSPWFFILRIGVILALLGGLSIATPIFERALKYPIIKVITQNSLIVYVVHLYFIYHRMPFWETSVRRAFAKSLTLTEAILVSIVVFMLSVAAAWVWDRAKRRAGDRYPQLRRAAWVVALAIFFFA